MQTLRLLPGLVAFIALSFPGWTQPSTPNSLSPGRSTVYHSPKKAKTVKYKKRKAIHSPQYEFYERVEKAAKEKQRILKKLGKAQFSDPRYFGHKRIPKRRLSFKMRYCAECGIRH